MLDKETYESYAHTLRCLINYHKRMMMMCESPCYKENKDTGEWELCERAVANNDKCPKASVINDVYLGALEESLRLIEEKIVAHVV